MLYIITLLTVSKFHFYVSHSESNNFNTTNVKNMHLHRDSNPRHFRVLLQILRISFTTNSVTEEVSGAWN